MQIKATGIMSVAFFVKLFVIAFFDFSWADGETASADCWGILKRRDAENTEEVLRTFSCSAKGFLTLFIFTLLRYLV